MVLAAAAALVAGLGIPNIASAQVQAKTAPKTVTVAYSPDGIPNYIFPMIIGASDTVPDLYWFIEQFYRPMYFFAKGGSSGLDESLSHGELAHLLQWGKRRRRSSSSLGSGLDGKPITTR